MKKIYLTLFVSALTWLCADVVAQVTKAGAEDYKDMMKRVLVVEIPDTLKKKTKAFPQDDYGQLLQEAAETYWKLNAKIEFRTAVEVQKLLEKGDKKYVYLYYSKHKDSKNDQVVHVLNYTRVAKDENSVDYSMYFPETKGRKTAAWQKYDFMFMLTNMQENIKNIQKTGTKQEARDFMFDQADKNCPLLKTKNVLVDQGTVSNDVDEKVYKRVFKKVHYTLTDTRGVEEGFEYGVDTMATILSIPREFISVSSSAFGEKYIGYQKIVVSLNDGKVIAAYGNKYRHNKTADFKEEDFVGMFECVTKKK